MNDRRNVRVTDRFFQDLDDLLPAERTAQGTPSATDFLLYEIPRLIERLAIDFEINTIPVDGAPELRVLITSGILVAFIAAYATLATDGAIDLVGLEIEP